MVKTQTDLVTTLTYQAISNDQPTYSYITRSIRSPERLRAYVQARYEHPTMRGVWKDLIGDLLDLVDWDMLYKALKDEI
jgi:hypothetical protein